MLSLVRPYRRSITLRVDIFGQFECVRVGQVGVGRRDSQDEAVFVADVLHDQVPYAVLYVRRLVAYRHFGDAGKVHQRQVEHCKHPRAGGQT